MNILFVYPEFKRNCDCLLESIISRRPQFILKNLERVFPDGKITIALPQGETTLLDYPDSKYQYLYLEGNVPYSLSGLEKLITNHKIHKVLVWWTPSSFVAEPFLFNVQTTAFVMTPSNLLWDDHITILNCFDTLLTPSINIQYLLSNRLRNKTIGTISFPIDANSFDVSKKISIDPSFWNILVPLTSKLRCDIHIVFSCLEQFITEIDNLNGPPICLHLVSDVVDYTNDEIRQRIFHSSIRNKNHYLHNSLPFTRDSLKNFHCVLYALSGESTGEYPLWCQACGVPVVCTQYGLFKDYLNLTKICKPFPWPNVSIPLQCNLASIDPQTVAKGLLEVYQFNTVERITQVSASQALASCLLDLSTTQTKIENGLIAKAYKASVGIVLVSDSSCCFSDQCLDIWQKYADYQGYDLFRETVPVSSIFSTLQTIRDKNFDFVVTASLFSLPLSFQYDFRVLVQEHSFVTSNQCLLSPYCNIMKYLERGEGYCTLVWKPNLLPSSINDLNDDTLVQWLYYNPSDAYTKPQKKYPIWWYNTNILDKDSLQLYRKYRETNEIEFYNLLIHASVNDPELGKIYLRPYGAADIQSTCGQWYIDPETNITNVLYPLNGKLMAIQLKL